MESRTLPWFQGLLILGTQFLDYKTTVIGLGLGAHELNGPMRHVIENYGIEIMLYVKLAVGVIATIVLRRRPVAAAVLTAMFLAAGINNLFVIARLLAA
jgi:hypothetical protein